MGVPIVIDSLSLVLGQFLRKRDTGRTVHGGKVDRRTPCLETPAPDFITLSSGQMLLPGIASPHHFQS